MNRMNTHSSLFDQSWFISIFLVKYCYHILQFTKYPSLEDWALYDNAIIKYPLASVIL